MQKFLNSSLNSALVLWFAIVGGMILLGFCSAILLLRGKQFSSPRARKWLLVLMRVIRALPWVILVLAVAVSLYNTLNK
jgi:hypothetical protein